MEFTEQFHVPADPDATFLLLTDLERVAPCMPGATLEGVEGSVYTGKIRLKVGPIQITYRGEVELTDKDPSSRRTAMTATGKDIKSTGTARANIVANMEPAEGGTMVTVDATVDVTGKPAQFGRGVMQEVGANIIRQFAQRLEAMVTAEGAGEGIAEEPAGTAGAAPRVEEDSLDLLSVAGAAAFKRLAVAAGAVAVVVVAIIWIVNSL